MPKKVIKFLSLVLCFCFLFEQSGFAQIAGELDISGHIAQLRAALIPDKFRPLHLRYLSYDNLNNNFKLLLDKGDFMKGLSPKGTVPEQKLKEATKDLLNYFFIGISLPNDSFWVNLRPDSPDNIIDPYLGQTDVGKILLEADLQLKKDTANFTSPQTPEGKEYWDKLYKKAGELFGSENITIPTLTRPWIVPNEIIIRESTDNAYIYKATLKVMLEQDYLKDSATYNFADERLKQLNEYSSQLIRETIIPKLTKDVNTAKRYAPLRQVYYSLILAQWFKQKFQGLSPKGTVPNLYVSLIDRRNLDNLTSKTPWDKQTYFKQYQTSFQQGEYNIKEPIHTLYGQTIRSYMSGGIEINVYKSASPITIKGIRSISKDIIRGLLLVTLVSGTLALPGLAAGDPAIAPLKTSQIQSRSVSTAGQKIQLFKSLQTELNKIEISSLNKLGESLEIAIQHYRIAERQASFTGKAQDSYAAALNELEKIKKEPRPKSLDFFIDAMKKNIFMALYARGNDEAAMKAAQEIGVIHEDLRGMELYMMVDNILRMIDIENAKNGRIPANDEYIKKLNGYLGKEGIKIGEKDIRDSNNDKIYNPVVKAYKLLKSSKAASEEVQTGKLNVLFVPLLRNVIILEELDLIMMGQLEGGINEKVIAIKLLQEFIRNDPKKGASLEREVRLNRVTLEMLREFQARPWLINAQRILVFAYESIIKNEGYVGDAFGISSKNMNVFEKITCEDIKINPETHMLFIILKDELGNKRVFGLSLGGIFGLAGEELKEKVDNSGSILRLQKILLSGGESSVPFDNLTLLLDSIAKVVATLSVGEKSASSAIKDQFASSAAVILNKILENSQENMRKELIDLERELHINPSVFSFGGVSYYPITDYSFTKANMVLIGDQWYRAVVQYEGDLEKPEGIKIINIYVSSRVNHEAQPFINLELISIDLKSKVKDDINRAIIGFKEADIYFKNQFYNPSSERNSNIFVPFGFYEEEKEAVVDWINNNLIIKHLLAMPQTLENVSLMSSDIFFIDYNAHLSTGASAQDKFIQHRGRYKKPDKTSLNKNKEFEEKVYRNAQGTFAHEIIHRIFPIYKDANVILQYLKAAYPSLYASILKQDSEEGILCSIIGALTASQPYVFPHSPGDKGQIKTETVEMLVKYGLLPGIMSPEKLGYNGEYISERYYELINPSTGSPLVPAQSASSAVESDIGGIDLRALPIVRQPMGGSGLGIVPLGRQPMPLSGTVPTIPIAELNKEWEQIENMLAAGITPSSERIKEYLQSCCKKEDFNQDIDKVLSCIADILRLEEERVASTDAPLKQMLALLESDKPADEMQLALSRITVAPKEPRIVAP